MGMQVGDPDGFGVFGVLDEDGDGLLCHDCGDRFTHLGLHAYKAHGVTAAEYRTRHGLGRQGLVTSATREAITANARRTLPGRVAFLNARDPAKASAAHTTGQGMFSPAGLEALREAARKRRGVTRAGIVITCAWCGAQFCPLTSPSRRRFCTRSCSAKHVRRSAVAYKSPQNPDPSQGERPASAARR